MGSARTSASMSRRTHGGGRPQRSTVGKRSSDVYLPTGEQLLPRESNVYMDVGVCSVEEHADQEGTPVGIILVASRHDASGGAWQLRFS